MGELSCKEFAGNLVPYADESSVRRKYAASVLVFRLSRCNPLGVELDTPALDYQILGLQV
jgi:hypothetical protein